MNNNQAGYSKEELEVIFHSDKWYNLDQIVSVEGVSTDSRCIAPGNIFIGIKGENHDGNEKYRDAIEGSAGLLILNEDFYDYQKVVDSGFPVIFVKNTISALGALGRHHRRRFDIPVLAVGGANGKTTTKDMISHVLSVKYTILSTSGNLNNQIGVPLTLLQLNSLHELAVIECGTNEPGEIALLSSIAEPTHGLITNIGREHLEKLIDLDGVEMEETFLYGYLRKYGGLCLINNDDERLSKYSKILDKCFTYGASQDSDLSASIAINENLNPNISFAYNKTAKTVNLKTIGYASGLNAIAAIAAGLVFELDVDELINSLETFTPDESHAYARMVLQNYSGIVVLNDCYNANPESMRMSLKTLAAFLSKGKKYAVLGDMREMGETSESEHKQLLLDAVNYADEIFVIGNEMGKASIEVQSDKITFFIDKVELGKRLKSQLNAQDIMLLKGSRGMKMEELLSYLKF
jgi:UDP-N-acetylmuramoyl-tripeptide--D-alanyl-D-alanine ligase